MVSEVGSVVGPESKEGVKAILESVRGMMNSEQLKQAVDDFKTALPKLQGDAVFVCIAGSLQSAAEMSGPVVAGVGSAILVLGEHLPYIAVAAGAVGTRLGKCTCCNCYYNATTVITCAVCNRCDHIHIQIKQRLRRQC